MLAFESIGKMYEKSQGVLDYYHLTMEWYLKAARLYTRNSCSWIGNLFLKGLRISQIISKAQEWFYKRGSQCTAIATAKSKGECSLTKEQEDKTIDILITETKNILQYVIFGTITFDVFMQMKNTELSLVGGIKILQESDSMFIKMHQEVSDKLQILKNENSTLKIICKINDVNYKQNTKSPQKVNSKLKTEMNAALQKVSALQKDDSQLCSMIAAGPVEKQKDLLKREIERGKAQTQAQKLKTVNAEHKQAEQHMTERVSDLEEKIIKLCKVVKNQQTEYSQLKSRINDKEDISKNVLLSLDQLRHFLEEEETNIDTLI
ncbi:hypothetical protein K501DRAFT_276047 [Backusella circina FSU 941]|nr:hypothetical protein K501DRAFT_280983 [Backusella circina FSU 941]KAI8879974.1 hypothetical protein K501DRAFT_276047 [Backusella circina FSU 941]